MTYKGVRNTFVVCGIIANFLLLLSVYKIFTDYAAMKLQNFEKVEFDIANCSIDKDVDEDVDSIEFQSVCRAVGGYEKLIDQECKDKDLLALVTYIAKEERVEKILENQKIIRTPIVRNGRQATVGYQPDVWKNWK